MHGFDVLKIVDFAARGGEPKTVVDGGFHTGSYTRKILSAWPDASIIGFEPDPEIYSAASRFALNYKNIELLNVALGSAAGRSELFRGDMAATNSLLPRPESHGRPYFPSAAQLSGGVFVDVVALDDALSERGVTRVSLLKLDLQGWELEALKGAQKLINDARVDVIQCEVAFVRKYQSQPLFWEICAHLARAEYSFHSFVDVKIGPYDPEATGPRQSQWNQADAIFVSPEVRRKMDL